MRRTHRSFQTLGPPMWSRPPSYATGGRAEDPTTQAEPARPYPGIGRSIWQHGCLGPLEPVQTAAFSQSRPGCLHLASGLVQDRFESSHPRVDEGIRLPAQRGGFCLGVGTQFFRNLLGNADHLTVLSQSGGVLAGVGKYPARFRLTFCNPGLRSVEHVLSIGDLVRQVFDHVVNRGQYLTTIDDAGRRHWHGACVHYQLTEVLKLFLRGLAVGHGPPLFPSSVRPAYPKVAALKCNRPRNQSSVRVISSPAGRLLGAACARRSGAGGRLKRPRLVRRSHGSVSTIRRTISVRWA